MMEVEGVIILEVSDRIRCTVKEIRDLACDINTEEIGSHLNGMDNWTKAWRGAIDKPLQRLDSISKEMEK